MITAKVSTADYDRIFEAERRQAYPVVDAFEHRMGYAIDRATVDEAGRVLACPMKKNAPNWQHGRVLYAAARHYLKGLGGSVFVLDIGTAKGFSALCLLWALLDSGVAGQVVSVDVIDPDGRVARNTVADPDGQKTLAEILAPWPETSTISFQKSTGVEWLRQCHRRVNIAFIDGNHTHDVVHVEGQLLAALQHPCDLAIFDDVNKKGLETAVFGGLKGLYKFERLDLPGLARSYAIGVRRG